MEPFKNHISRELVSCVAGHLERQMRGFDKTSFEASVFAELERLELKERIQLIADAIQRVLPKAYRSRHRILLAMLHPSEDATGNLQSDKDGVRGWGTLALSAVVGQHGLDAFDESLSVLREMTKRFSSEFDVRYFLLADQDRAMQIMSGWCSDPNRHVRRLVSEGTRPRLPWAMRLPKLIADPSPALPLLEALRDDEDDYVRRSVANHLNDISKDHPDLVADIAKQWLTDADRARTRLLRHACRTLIKQGHREALEIFGFDRPRIAVSRPSIKERRIRLGGELAFSVRLRSKSGRPQSLVIDYLVHFLKKNGRLAAKVFKWRTFTLGPGQAVTLERVHALRMVTTRKHYPGEHALSLRINGQDFGQAFFKLIET